MLFMKTMQYLASAHQEQAARTVPQEAPAAPEKKNAKKSVVWADKVDICHKDVRYLSLNGGTKRRRMAAVPWFGDVAAFQSNGVKRRRLNTCENEQKTVTASFTPAPAAPAPAPAPAAPAPAPATPAPAVQQLYTADDMAAAEALCSAPTLVEISSPVNTIVVIDAKASLLSFPDDVSAGKETIVNEENVLIAKLLVSMRNSNASTKAHTIPADVPVIPAAAPASPVVARTKNHRRIVQKKESSASKKNTIQSLPKPAVTTTATNNIPADVRRSARIAAATVKQSSAESVVLGGAASSSKATRGRRRHC